MTKFKVTLNIVLVTSIIALAISYLTQLISVLPKINFLEAAGMYCLWTPIHHYLNDIFSSKKEN